MTTITNLKDSPQFKKQAQSLIEKSFNYNNEESFAVDFYPLFNEDNFHQCYILIKDEVVIGHIGCLQKEIELNSTHLINMFGGIAIAEEHQGQGHFKSFFEEIYEKHNDVALSFLWSDKLALYEKFNFFPCVNLIQYYKTEGSPLESKSLDKINDQELALIKKLYQCSQEVRIERTDKDWEKIKKITSAEIYFIKNEGKVINYFIKNKGQDLQGIIHEYGTMNEDSLKIMMSIGIVWTPFISDESHQCQQLYGSIAKLGNFENFEAFLHEFAKVKLIKLEEDQVMIQIEDEEFSLSQRDFLSGLLGPNTFSEIKAANLFISGLDSI